MNNDKPHHLPIGRDEAAGNAGRGRVFFLPGSPGRAARFAEHFDDPVLHRSSREINAWLGTIDGPHGRIDVGALPTGMGAPSTNIVVTELFSIGVRRVLRVGTAGSLQPRKIRAGSLVIATGAVRDEATSDAYAPRDLPATAHPDWVQALVAAARAKQVTPRTFTGLVHCKDAFYGREFPMGPLARQNEAYMQMLRGMGVLATEMESSHLFILAQAHGMGIDPISQVSASVDAYKAGALLAVIGDDESFASLQVEQETESVAIEVAIEAVRSLMGAEG